MSASLSVVPNDGHLRAAVADLLGHGLVVDRVAGHQLWRA